MLYFCVILLFALPAFSQPTDQGSTEIANAVTALESASNYSTLVQLLQNPTYFAALNLTDGTNKTLFAPSDSAFTALAGLVDLVQILADESLVISILSYHIIPSYLPAETILSVLSTTNPISVATLEGSSVNVTLNGSFLFVNTAEVVGANILASGITAVHGINGVLVPPAVLESLGDAPIPASAPAPSPSTTPSSPPPMAPSPSPPSDESVNGTKEVELVATNLMGASGNYSILLNLLGNTTFASALNLSDGADKTVFAPTNEAFTSLPSDVSALLSNSSIVIQILQYHIVPLYLPASTILSVLDMEDNATTVPTLLGQTVNVTLSESGLKVNNSTVSETDIVASNVTAVHGIDRILLPNLAVTSMERSPPPASLNQSPPPSASGSISRGVSLTMLIFSCLGALLLV